MKTYLAQFTAEKADVGRFGLLKRGDIIRLTEKEWLSVSGSGDRRFRTKGVVGINRERKDIEWDKLDASEQSRLIVLDQLCDEESTAMQSLREMGRESLVVIADQEGIRIPKRASYSDIQRLVVSHFTYRKRVKTEAAHA